MARYPINKVQLPPTHNRELQKEEESIKMNSPRTYQNNTPAQPRVN